MAQPTDGYIDDGYVDETPKGGPSSNYGTLERYQDAYKLASLEGFGGAIANKFMDWTDQGKDLIRKAHPDWDEDRLEAASDKLLALNMRAARQEIEERQAANPAWKPDQSFWESAASGQWVPKFAGMILGGADPTMLVNPGGSAGTRVLAQGGLSGAADAGYQLNDILTGVADKYDAWRTGGAALGGAALQGLFEAPRGIYRTLRGLFSRGDAAAPKIDAAAFRDQAQGAFDQGATREQLDAMAEAAGLPKWGNDLDVAIEFRDNGGKGATIVNREGQPQARVQAAPATPEEPDIVVTGRRPPSPRNESREPDGYIDEEPSAPPAREDNVVPLGNWEEPPKTGPYVDYTPPRPDPEGFETRQATYVTEDGRTATFVQRRPSADDHWKNTEQVSGDQLSQQDIAYTAGRSPQTGVMDARKSLREAAEGTPGTLQVARFDPSNPDRHRFSFIDPKSGNEVYGDFSYNGGRVHDFDVWSAEGKGAVGPATIARIRRQIETGFSDARELEGYRISGGREASGRGAETVSIPLRGRGTTNVVDFRAAQDAKWLDYLNEQRASLEGQEAASGGAGGRGPTEPPREPPSEPPSGGGEEPPSGGDNDNTPREKYLGNINTERLELNNRTYDMLEQATRDLNLDSTTHEEVKAAALKMLQERTVDDILTKAPSLDEAAAHGVATRAILVDTLDRSERIADEILDPKTDTTAAREQLNVLRLRLAAATDRASRNARLAGQLLNSYNIRANKADFDKAKALKEFGPDNLTLDEYAAKIAEFRDNPQAQVQLAKDTVRPLPEDYITSLRYTFMLSGLGTHAKNALGNATLMAADLAEHGFGMVLGQARRIVGNDSLDRITAREVGYRIRGLMKAMIDGGTYRDTARSFVESTPVHAVSKVEKGQPVLPGVLEYPKKLLAASDQFFRSLIQESNMHGLAVRKAHREGLKGDDFWARVDELIANPSKDMIEQTDRHAEVLQLLSDPSPLGRFIEAGKSRRPNMTGAQRITRFALQNVFPFARVTDNLLFANLRRSPLAFMDKVTRQDWKAGGARQDLAKARVALGTAFLGTVAYMAMNGMITGNGPEDYRKRRELEGGGWQGSSFKVGDKYYSLNGLDAISINANAMATLVEKYQSGEISQEDYLKQAGGVTSSTLELMNDNTFTSNIADFMSMFQKGSRGETARANYVGGLASSFVPLSGLVGQTNRAYIDPAFRDTTGDKSFGDRVQGRVMSGIPGLSDNLPQRVSVYGVPESREGAVGPDMAGIGVTRTESNDPTIRELQRLAKGQQSVLVGPVPTTVKIDGENKKLNAEELQQYQYLSGSYIRTWTQEAMADSSWNSMSDDEKRAAVKDIVKDARKQARDELFNEPEPGGKDGYIDE